jgi:type IV pilus assembly protein PilA
MMMSGSNSEEEQGFTLIELMVVLLIVAILLAIAIPTFLGVSGSANDRAAQSNLSTAVTEAKAMFEPNQSYATVYLAAATLTTSAPEFSWVQSGACTAASPAHCVSEYPVDVISPDGGRGVILATLSKSGICWYAVDLEAFPTTTAFTDTGGTVQFLAGTANGHTPNFQKIGGTALTTEGDFYSQKKTTTCDARTPTTNATAWNWGLSYAAAPLN